MASRGHKLLAASAASRWLNCAASPVLSIIAAERESGDAARFGTMAHRYAELMLTTNIDGAEEKEKLKEELLASAPENLEIAERYIGYILSLRKAGIETEFEVKLSLSVLCGGTADCLAKDTDFGCIEVVDLKTGRATVDPSTQQTGVYLLHPWRKYGKTFRYKATIVQQGAQSHEWSHDALALLDEKVVRTEEVVRDIVSGTKTAYAFANAGKHCDYCPAFSLCEKRKEEDYGAVAGTPMSEVFKGKAPLGKPAVLSTTTRAQILKATPQVIKYLKENEEGLLEEAQAGTEIPGFRIGTKRVGEREWKTPTVAQIELLNAGYENIFTKKELLSPAKMEKLGEKAKEIVEKHTTRKEGKPALVANNESSEPNFTEV